MQNSRQFYINGVWVDPYEANDFAVENPATGETVNTISLGSAADVDRAVAAARDAFASYSQTSREERLALLERVREVYKKRYNDMAVAISTEMGAPKTLAETAQAWCGLHHIEEGIKALKNFSFEDELEGARVVKEPIGVCALITPWNWPVNQIALKVVPALATGCTMVLKPSEIAPLSALLWTEIMHEAGVPAGVYNMVNGDGLGVGAPLSCHSDVDMVTFTGSTRAGAAITKAAADTVKQVALELGGKSPNIILDDANLKKAVTAGVLHCMENTGQSCNAPTRMLVPKSLYNEAAEIARNVAESVEVGDPGEKGDHIGPLVSRVHFEKVQGLIQKGIDEGAKLLCGGVGRPDGYDKGYFTRPTVFADVNNDMTIARQEIFGPVLCLIPYEGDEEAVAIGNDTPYGLSAYVQGEPAHALRIANRIKAGMVHINGSSLTAGGPFGGYKQSGNGREGGAFGFEDFLEIKIINGFGSL